MHFHLIVLTYQKEAFVCNPHSSWLCDTSGIKPSNYVINSNFSLLCTAPLCRVRLEKLTFTQLVKKFTTFYETQRITTVFTRARHWSLYCVRCIQSLPSQYNSVRAIVIYSRLRLGLPNGLFPLGFPTRIVYAFLLPPIRAAQLRSVLQNSVLLCR